MHAYHLGTMKPLLTALMLGNAALFVFGTRRRVSELPVMSCIIGKFESSTLLRIEVSEK